MSAAATPEVTPGRLFILFLAQLRVEGHHAVSAWTSHADGDDWDHIVDAAVVGATASQAARMKRASLEMPAVHHRHVKGGVSEVTAAASQLLGKDGGQRILLCYVGGPGQADSLTDLGAALAPAVTGDTSLTVFVGKWGASLGHHQQWERVWSAFQIDGPDVAAEEEEAPMPHPVIDRLAPRLPAMPAS